MPLREMEYLASGEAATRQVRVWRVSPHVTEAAELEDYLSMNHTGLKACLGNTGQINMLKKITPSRQHGNNIGLLIGIIITTITVAFVIYSVLFGS
ncbi:hypothetical protein ABID44_000207 [Aquamicrobium ahrensii]|uniref:Uncharacterized protein n=1 Tax=Aquamicrobium ahrensii TaxID=469551 RepID=A0ABV2KFN5_9HYPH